MFDVPSDLLTGNVAEASELGWPAWPTQFRSGGKLFCFVSRDDDWEGDLMCMHYKEYLGDRWVTIFND